MIKIGINDKRFKIFLKGFENELSKVNNYFAEEMVDNIRKIYLQEANDTGALANSVSYRKGQKSAVLNIGNQSTIRKRGKRKLGQGKSINYAYPVEYGVKTGIGKKFFNERIQAWQRVKARPGIDAIDRSITPAITRTIERMFNNEI